MKSVLLLCLSLASRIAVLRISTHLNHRAKSNAFPLLFYWNMGSFNLHRQSSRSWMQRFKQKSGGMLLIPVNIFAR